MRLSLRVPRPTHESADATARQGGFTIVETLVALTLVFAVLTGTLATFSASVRNVATGRQRTGAVSLAREVVETGRAALYSQVGHDLAGDATLSPDPAVSGTPPAFEGEELVGAATPLFAEHQWVETRDGTTFDVSVYVTWVAPSDADPYKRMTVVVAWRNAQHDSAVMANDVRVSSFLFPAGVPPDPLVDGSIDVDTGVFSVTGTLGPVEHDRTSLFNPSAGGTLHSLFTREATGDARSASAVVELLSGSVSGCGASGGLVAECPGVHAASLTDSDAATQVPEHHTAGPATYGGATVDADSVFSIEMGTGDAADSRSTARSCFSCHWPQLGDDDSLAHHWSQADGPSATAVAYSVGSVTGQLLAMSAAARATATLDQDVASNSHILRGDGEAVVPALDLVTVTGGPEGYAGAVRVDPVTVKAHAEAGPTATTPSISGDSFSVQIWDAGSYRTVSISPGDAVEETASATFQVDGATVTLTTTVVAGGKTVSSTTDTDGVVTTAEASLSNWLRIEVRLQIGDDSGSQADTVAEFDYGRVAARVQYEAGS